MQTTRSARGIANGHWESEESRSGWLLLLARLGIAELRALGDIALSATHARDVAQRSQLVDSAAAQH